MAKGGYRPGAGRPKGSGTKRKDEAESVPVVTPEGATPLDYMLAVMRDEAADETRRDRMAIAAAPFMHVRAGEQPGGQKAQAKEAAKRAATSGKFATPEPPRLVIVPGDGK